MIDNEYLRIEHLRNLLARTNLAKTFMTCSIEQDRFIASPRLRLVGQVADNFRSGETIDIGIDSFVPPIVSEKHFFDWLESRFIECYVHEAREQFIVDGMVWDNPHA